jgi:hypothetical protein
VSRYAFRALCTGSTGGDLSVSSDRYFHSPRSQFNITVGNSYWVAGMGIWETVLMVLIRDDSDRPSWFPVALFDMSVTALPHGWEFRLLDKMAASGGESDRRWVAMWGYPELVRDSSHSDSLIERKPEALRIFAERLGT